MGFHKRYLNKEIIYRSLKENKIINLFTKADAFMFEDDESSYAYTLFEEGNTNNEILEKLKNKYNEDN